jgi:ABC-type nickel/cobalt efflux system permease component RcnA
MSHELALLAATAAGIGFLHTILGPDHCLPFVLMGRAGRWSRAKTLRVTLACGLGHVGSSLALAGLGAALGLASTRLEAIESFRGQLAVWALIGFGLVYMVWGLRRAARRRPHAHPHAHGDGTVHVHEHVHEAEHLHVHPVEHEHAHAVGAKITRLTPWVLFTLFIFGPCEPLIALVLVPAAEQSVAGVTLVASVFSVATLATMVVAVAVVQAGVGRLPLGRLERYTHALAGAALALCGVALQILNL